MEITGLFKDWIDRKDCRTAHFKFTQKRELKWELKMGIEMNGRKTESQPFAIGGQKKKKWELEITTLVLHRTHAFALDN